MRIAILSYAYAPSLGGIESVTRLVADGLVRLGHEIVIVTSTPGASDDEERVVRRPGTRRLLETLRSVDAVVESNPALHLSWPLAIRLIRRPRIVVCHTPIARTDGRLAWKDRLKVGMLPGASYAVSGYLARQISRRPMRTIADPYDDAVFRPRGVSKRSPKDLLFVGRLTRAKGADILLDALGVLARDDAGWTLTIVGAGEELGSLIAQSHDLGIAERVRFLGRLEGHALADVMSRHRVLAVPSRRHPAEAFGLVAIEGIATGMAVVASDVGGLPEAVGRSGQLVEPERVDSLVDALRRLASDPTVLESFPTGPEAVARHTVDAVAEAYESALVLQAHGVRAEGGGSDMGEP